VSWWCVLSPRVALAISISLSLSADIATVHLLSDGISLQSTYFLAMIVPLRATQYSLSKCLTG
jgi:hypothetical protein